MLVAVKPVGGAVQARQPAAIGADPQHAVAILENRQHGVVGQAELVVRIVAVGPELAGPGVVAGQPAPVGADPQGAIPVGHQGPDAVTVQGLAGEGLESAGLQVQPAQPATIGTHP